MKKLFVLMLLIPCAMMSQTKVVKKAPIKKKATQVIKEDPNKETMLKDKDFVIDEDGAHGNRQTILMNDGSEKPVETKFLFAAPQEKFKKLGLQQINMVLHISNYKTALNMKNKYTYQPRKASLFYSEDKGKWTCAIEYTAQNDYGALKSGTIFYTYDEEGNFLESLGGY
jgi:hypothetical protein